MKFYPSDWRADEALRSCSIAARGLWVEMMALMHVAEPYGSLLINGKRPDKKRLASLAGISEKECTELLFELEGVGVFSRDDDGTIYSRRMRRDAERAVKDKENGALGGNPKVKAGVNPPDNLASNPTDNGGDKAQIPEARIQNNSAATASGADAPPDPSAAEREFFKRGREVLGKSAGGQLAKLKNSQGHNIALARAIIETASQKENPAEYVAAVVNGKRAPPARPMTEYQRKQAESRSVFNEICEFNARTGSAGDHRNVRHDSGDGSEDVLGGPGGSLIQLSADRD